jgi:pimeloyl-ACP methyl ester carboxylesterase
VRDATLTLPDGRALAYCEWGDPNGAPVLHFHGVPGCRLECWGGAAAYAAAGARLITVDRPGIGRSDAKPRRTLLDWADDVEQLADAVGAGRFAVTGHSAGGAYALACAYALPRRVARVALVAGVPRLDSPAGIDQLGTARYWKLAHRHPSRMRTSYRVLTLAIRFVPPLGHWLFFRHAAEADRSVVDHPAVSRRFRETVLEAARPGVRGLVDDMRAMMQPWGFRPEDISVDVDLWHGGQDHHVPREVGEAYAESIPRCRATFVDGEGHFSLIETRAEEIVVALAGN